MDQPHRNRPQQIYRLHARGWRVATLAARFHVSIKTIYQELKGHLYK